MDLTPIFEFIKASWSSIKFWVVLDEWEEGVVFRWGKYHRTLPGGDVYRKIPFMEVCRAVDMNHDSVNLREDETATQNLTTKDNFSIEAAISLKYQIIDSKKFVVTVNEPKDVMRDIIAGGLTEFCLDHDFEDCLNYKGVVQWVQERIKKELDEYGVRVVAVHLEAMQLKPEEITREAITEAATTISKSLKK